VILRTKERTASAVITVLLINEDNDSLSHSSEITPQIRKPRQFAHIKRADDGEESH
jgi:hypothetical protein